MALDIYVDPISGGYTVLDNKLTYVNVTINKINILLNMKIGSYIYAPTSGNPLLDMDGALSVSDITQGINACLYSLIQSGEITNIEIQSVQTNRVLMNKYIINIVVILPNGDQPLITWKT